MKWLKKLTKPLTSVVFLVVAIAATQLANIVFYSLAAAGFAQFLVFLAQASLAAAIVSGIGYLATTDDD